MEDSILKDYFEGGDDRTRQIADAVKSVAVNHRPMAKLTTQYDRSIETTPLDDYEALAIINENQREETVKDKSYLMDATRTFLNQRDQINLMTERGKLVKDINPAIDAIDFQLKYLSDKKSFEDIVSNVLPTLDKSTREYQEVYNQAQQLQQSLSQRSPQYTEILDKYGETEGVDLNARIEQLNKYREDWVKQKDDVVTNINELYGDLSSRNERYKVSARYQLEEQKSQDKAWYSKDYLTYGMPGLVGSSMATAETYLADAAIAGALHLGRHYMATAAMNATPHTAALNGLIAGVGATAAATASVLNNLYGRNKESLAQAYGAYRSRLEKDLQDQYGVNINDYVEQARVALREQDPNIDVNKISDEEIIDRVLAGELSVSDEKLQALGKQALSGVEKVYRDNMALSAIDVAQSALTFAPIGGAFRKIIVNPIGKAVSKVVSPAAKLAAPVASRYNKALDAYLDFNARMAIERPVVAATQKTAKRLLELGFAAGGEAFEEAAQDIYDYDYINGKYDNASLSPFASIMRMANANLRTAKIVAGIDTESELANDPQFWNDMKGGLALGMFMSGPIKGFQSTKDIYKDLSANHFVRDVVADQISKKDMMLKSQIYADRANKKLNYQENVVDILEAYKRNLPEGLTVEDIDNEIKVANSVFNLARSSANKEIAKSAGISPGTTEYNTFIGLQQLATENYKEAFNNHQDAVKADNDFWANLQTSDELSGYSDADKGLITTVARLNVQKQALNEVLGALKMTPEEHKEKFGIAREDNPLYKTLIKDIPKSIKLIDAQLAQLTEGTNYDTEFNPFANSTRDAIDLYNNSLIAGTDEMVSKAKRNELFGIATKDGKLTPFKKLTPKEQKAISKGIKERVKKYLEDSENSTKVVEDNSKDYVNKKQQEEAAKQATEQSDSPEQPLTTNESQGSPTPPTEPPAAPPVPPTVNTTIPTEEGSQPETPAEQPKPEPPTATQAPADDDLSAFENYDFSKPPIASEEDLRKQAIADEAIPLGKGYAPVEDTVTEEQKKKTLEEAQKKLEAAKKKAKETTETTPSEKTENGEQYTSTDDEPSTAYDDGDPRAPKSAIDLKNEEDLKFENDAAKREGVNTNDSEYDILAEIDDAFEKGDKVSHTLFFSPESTKPMLPGYKPGKELAKLLNTPEAFGECEFEFIIDPKYTEKGSKPYKPGKPSTYDSATILLQITHSTGKYLMALKTPKGARELLDPTTTDVEAAIQKLRDFRNSIITAFENKKDTEAIVPVDIRRSNGKYDTLRKEENGVMKAVFRPVQEVEGFGIPSNPYAINKENVKLGLGRGIIADKSIMGPNGSTYLLGTGGSGQVFLYVQPSRTLSGRELPTQVNMSRFTKEQAEFLVDVLLSNADMLNSLYKDSGIVAQDIIDFMVRFGNETRVDDTDPRFDFIRSKQFYIDENGNIVIGNDKFDRGNLTSGDKRRMVQLVQGMHWRVNKETIWDNLQKALPSAVDYLRSNYHIQEITIIPGVTITADELLGTRMYPKGMPTMGWMITNNLMQTDLSDQMFKDPFVHASSIQVIDRVAPEDTPTSPVITKAENLIAIPEASPEVTPEPATPQAAEPTVDTTTNDLERQFLEEFLEGDDDPFNSGAPRLESTRKSSDKVTPEEITWFKNKLGLTSDQIEMVDTAIDLGNDILAMGLSRVYSTVLWKGAERGTLYHEAFHKVSLLLLTPKERKRIYEAYRNRTGFVGTDTAAEEALAEDFRSYMLSRVEPDLNIVKRAFRAIKNFVKRWVWRTDTSIDNIFQRINEGYYSNKIANKQSIEEFKANYSNFGGAPFTIEGHKFENITNTQFDETINSLVSSFLSFNKLKTSDDFVGFDAEKGLAKLKAAINPALSAKLVSANRLTPEQAKVRNEIYDTFDSIFKPRILGKLGEYSIRLINSYQKIEEEVADREVGNAVEDAMNGFTKQSTEISVKNNALTAVKLFVLSLPEKQFADGNNNELVSIKSPITGFPLTVNYDQAWNSIMNNLHSKNTFQEMIDESARLGKQNPLFKTLYEELRKITILPENATEAEKIASENLQTQIRNTFRKTKHNMVGVLTEDVVDSNGKTSTNIFIKDENSSKLSRSILEGWTYSLIQNGNLFSSTEDGFSISSEQAENLKSLIKRFNDLNSAVNKAIKNPSIRTKDGDTNMQRMTNKLGDLKNEIINILDSLGVSIDMDTLNAIITRDYYNDNPVVAFYNFISDDTGKGLKYFFKGKVANLANISNSGIIKDTYEKKVTRYYNDSGILKRLSTVFAEFHPTDTEMSLFTTDNKLMYPVSEHNYFTDTTQDLNRGAAILDKLTKVLYNTGNNTREGYFKGSVLLTNLMANREGNGKLSSERFIYFKKSGSADRGRSYTEISPLEDYVTKMIFTASGRIVLPTMGDSQAYDVLKGSAVSNFNAPLDMATGSPRFDIKILRRFANYFETELDTIEFNYNHEPTDPARKIKNYDTGNRNGYRFRYFDGVFNMPTSTPGQQHSFNEALKLAEEIDKQSNSSTKEASKAVVSQIRTQWNKMPETEKLQLMNNYLWDSFVDELNYAAQLGVISWNGKDISSVRNLGLSQTHFNKAVSHYSGSKIPAIKKYSKALGATELLANHFANTIYSIIEFEKLYVKDPAYYKDPVDKIKRLREVYSTGVTPRLDYGEGNPMSDFTEANVGILEDNTVISRQLDSIYDKATNSIVFRMLREKEGYSSKKAWDAVYSGEVSEEILKAARKEAEQKFKGYTEINQTDASVLISPEFYKQLVRRIDGWKPEVARAFEILNNPDADYQENMEVYNEALEVTLKPLKFMYFGDYFDEELKRDIPIFDKMAMFPVHRVFAKGSDMAKVLEVMENPERPIHMLAFESAVKVGQSQKGKIYTKDDKVDVEGLGTMSLRKQDIKNFRRQLITDPHHAERQMFVSQAQKAMMGNVILDNTYRTTDGELYSGKEVFDHIKGALDQLTIYGKQEFDEQFGITEDAVGNPIADKTKTIEVVRQDAINNGLNKNVIEGLTLVNGEPAAPLSGLSDNSWIESRIISTINRMIIDVKTPGGMFIQMSSVMYNKLDDSDGAPKRVLRFDNQDGSMDAVISINLLKHIIPDYKNKTFAEAKKWLEDHNVIGLDSNPAALGYRIPAQGKSSTVALKIVDVYDERIGDTVTLPDEFTALTGSDFDIDKLFVARYNYDKNGNKIKFYETAEEAWEGELQRLAESGLSDSARVAELSKESFINEWRSKGSMYAANSKEANENHLIDMYMSLVTEISAFSETRQPLDTVTGYLKNEVLSDIDNLTGANNRVSKSQLYYVTPTFQSKTKAELLSGKSNLGAFALSTTHHIISQWAGLQFVPNDTLASYDLKSPSGIVSNDQSGINILDWLSALINAHVDVAKDPYIIRLNVRSLTLNMTNLLIRCGCGENTFYFLSQKILRDYAQEYEKYIGYWGVNLRPGESPNFKARSTITKKYSDKLKKLAKTPEQKKQLENFNKGIIPSDLDVFDKSYLRSILTEEKGFDWHLNQMYILRAYEDLEPFAKALSELTTISQIDTKKFGNNFGLQAAFLDKLKKFLADDKVFDNAMAVFSNTMLKQKLEDGLLRPRQAFSGILLRLTPKFEAIRSLYSALTAGYTVRDDTYINNLTRGMEAQYKSAFMNEIASSRYTEEEFKDLFFGHNSIPARLNRLRKDIRAGKYPNLLASNGELRNALLNNVSPRHKFEEVERESPDFIELKFNKDGDSNVDDIMIRAWEELLDSEYPEVIKFAEDMAIYAFYTSGDAFGKNNLFKFVPNTLKDQLGFFDKIRNLESTPDSLSDYISFDELCKNMWWNDHIVPAMEFYRESTDIEDIDEMGKRISYPLEHLPSTEYISVNGKVINVPEVIWNTRAGGSQYLGINAQEQEVYAPYMKVKLDGTNNPKSTMLYKFIGTARKRENDVLNIGTIYPIYVLVNKKGMNYSGNVFTEFGRDRSLIPYNNILQRRGYTAQDIANWLTQLGDFQRVTNLVPTDFVISDYTILPGVTGRTTESTTPAPIDVESWSQKEGWSTEYFNRKVLPRLNEAWQIEFELASDQTVKADYSGQMSFVYREGEARPGLNSKNTLEAIQNGERTATTRYESDNAEYWKQAKVGDVIEWKSGDQSVKVIVTKPLTKLIDTTTATSTDSLASSVNNTSNTNNDPINFNNIDQSKVVISSDHTILTNEELNKLKPFTGEKPRIAVASEYTDPAFFSKQIIDILDGKTSTTDKFGRTFTGKDFNALYIITKHDGLPIENLLKYAIPKVIHFSITGLGSTQYEPGVMKSDDMLDRIQAMLKLGLDPEAVTIRIDPIVPGVTSRETIENIVRRASEMGIKNIRFSIMDQYSTTKKYMEQLGYDYTKYYDGNSLHAKESIREQIEAFMDSLIDKYDVIMSTCAEPLTSHSRIRRDACLSVSAVNNMLGTSIPESEGKGKRKLCACFGGKTDLLKYDNKCASSCAYCYAHHNNDKTLQYYNEDGSLKDIPLTKVSTTSVATPVATQQPSSVETINVYAGTEENADLSNFAIRPIDPLKIKDENWELEKLDKLYDALAEETFQTVEGAFQAAKLGYTSAYDTETGIWNDDGIKLHDKLTKASGSEAKKLGRTIKGLDIEAWDSDSSMIMKFLIKASFEQNPEALQRLLSTGNATLTHTQDKGKWGTEFPRILMEVREELRTTATPSTEDTTPAPTNALAVSPQTMKEAEDLKQSEKEKGYIYTFSDGYEVQVPFKLNDQQIYALQELEKFVKDNQYTAMALAGYAGTGKTTILGILNKWLEYNTNREIVFSSPSHRANAVTRSKLGRNANIMTLQKMLGLSPDFDLTEKAFDLRQLKFKQKSTIKVPLGGVIFIDESSWISEGLFQLLNEAATWAHAKIVYIGDEAQLRPVMSNKKSPVFTQDIPRVQLTKVERTDDNPILYESTRLRNHEGYSGNSAIAPSGRGVVFTDNRQSMEDYIRSVVASPEFASNPLYFRILAATNSVADYYNSLVRLLRYGPDAEQFIVGDLIMGRDNKYWNSLEKRFELVNSGDYIVTGVEKITRKTQLLSGKDSPLFMTKLTLQDAVDRTNEPFAVYITDHKRSREALLDTQYRLENLWKEYNQYKANRQWGLAQNTLDDINSLSRLTNTVEDVLGDDGTVKIKRSISYGYSHTIHKSQGGTYNRTLILDDTIANFGSGKNVKELRNELRYVAMTRATDYVMVFQGQQSSEVSARITEEDLSVFEGYDFNNPVIATREQIAKEFSDETEFGAYCKK